MAVAATLAFAETRASHWTNLLRAWKVRSRAVVVTDRRVLLVEINGLPYTVKSILAAHPRDGVTLAAFQDGPFTGHLKLEIDGDPPIELAFRQQWKSQARAVAAALRA